MLDAAEDEGFLASGNELPVDDLGHVLIGDPVREDPPDRLGIPRVPVSLEQLPVLANVQADHPERGGTLRQPSVHLPRGLEDVQVLPVAPRRNPIDQDPARPALVPGRGGEQGVDVFLAVGESVLEAEVHHARRGEPGDERGDESGILLELVELAEEHDIVSGQGRDDVVLGGLKARLGVAKQRIEHGRGSLRPAGRPAAILEKLERIEQEKRGSDHHQDDENRVSFHALREYREARARGNLARGIIRPGPQVFFASAHSLGPRSIFTYWARVYAQGSFVLFALSLPRNDSIEA